MYSCYSFINTVSNPLVQIHAVSQTHRAVYRTLSGGNIEIVKVLVDPVPTPPNVNITSKRRCEALNILLLSLN